jgi:D-sedoheptulose 7-phosphate isomerase
MWEVFERAITEAQEALRAFQADPKFVADLERVGLLIADCFKRRGRVFACGNGGSMADAIHFAEEWTGRFKADRKPYPALALGEAAHMTCVSNDYGFQHVFSRQIEAFGHEGDVLILLTTSGNSPNIIEAAKAARAAKLTVVGFLGKGGGEVKDLCDIAMVMPGKTSDRIQELHMMSLHALIEAVEINLGHGEPPG